MIKAVVFILLLPLTTIAQRLLEPNEFEKSLRENPDAIVLDLRDIDAYMKGHIKKSILIDFLRDDFKEYFNSRFKKTDNLYLYGQSAESSSHVTHYIEELGYTNVKGLKGGFENWIRKSKPYKSNAKDFKPLSFMTEQNYTQIIKEKKWTVVIFYEDYCKDCAILQSEIDDLKSELPELHIAKIDFLTNVELAERLQIYKNPTLILYKDGIQQWKNTGITSKEKLKEHIY